MGLEIVLEDERGVRVDWVTDPTNILHRILPTSEDDTFRCLSRVDRYGDTVFNRLQAGDVVEEIRRIAKHIRDPREGKLLERIAELALHCQRTPHLYLKFYGD